MTKEEKLRLLIKHLEKTSSESRRTAEKRNESYVRGLYNGEAIAYELCANWIKEILT